MNQNKKLPPPIIEGTLPAFYGTELTVPFVMNKAVSINEFDSFEVKIKSALNNALIKTETVILQQDLNKVIFNISADLVTGRYYKIQMAYRSGDIVGYYSDIGIAKYTTEPEVFIENLNKDTINPHVYNYIGKYSQINGDATEKVHSYCFNLYQDNDLIKTTNWILHNSSLDENSYESFDLFNLEEDLDLDKIYYIEYKIKTNNNLIVSSGKYPIKQKVLYASDQLINILPILNYENGYIELNFKSDKPLIGDFIISKSDASSDFKKWHDIYTLNLRKDSINNFSFKDFDVAYNQTYKYAIAQTNKYNLLTEKQISEPITVLFEDMFLFDGEKQLKIRFNPKVSSFKNYILETKVDTIGSKYPFFFRNGSVKYKEFPINGLISCLMDEEQLFMENEFVSTNLIDSNIYQEKEFKLKVLEWLGNGQSKLFKSPVEGNYIVYLMNVNLTPIDTLGRMLHSFSCNAYEIADYTDDGMRDQGILKIQNYTPNLLTFETISLKGLEGNILPREAHILYFDGLTNGIKLSIDNKEIIIGSSGIYQFSSFDKAIKTISLLEGEWGDNAQLTYGYYKDDKSDFDNIIAIEGQDLEKEYEGEVNIYQDLNTSNTSVSFLNSAKFSIKSDASSEEYKDYDIKFGDNVVINLKDLKTKEYYIENIKIKGLSIGKEIIAKINYYQHNLTRNGG